MSFRLSVRCQRDLERAVEQLGFVPLFRNSIPGFSVEEHVSPRAWFPEDGDGVWEWKGPVIRNTGCAYGKFFERKAVLVSREWFWDLANYRRDGYDFDARYDDGLARRADKDLYDLVAAHGPVLSRELKALGDYRKGGRSGFEGGICRLQELGYVVISDFVYLLDRDGEPYGWGLAQYDIPERALGPDFADRVYARTPQESYARLFEHLRALLPRAGDDAIGRLLK